MEANKLNIADVQIGQITQTFIADAKSLDTNRKRSDSSDVCKVKNRKFPSNPTHFFEIKNRIPEHLTRKIRKEQFYRASCRSMAKTHKQREVK